MHAFSWNLLFEWHRGDNDEREYLVKWKELPYDECYWESESDISAFQPEIERFNRFRSRSSKLAFIKQKSRVNDDNELKKQQKEFHQYEHSPEFLSGGIFCNCPILLAALCFYFSDLDDLDWLI
jgi:hypothetical protein